MVTPGRIIFIGNIPYNTSREELADICASYGAVRDVRIVPSFPDADRPSVGFAEFQDQKGAENAIRNMNDFEINGHLLLVKRTGN
uniref:RRM domain-containing protein n=2 Tax=Meloidogyne TaxID=189290 RepID=A0A6V7VZD5_MELEN|nr:unnamed protein product [Meloidogyne enterolobii]